MGMTIDWESEDWRDATSSVTGIIVQATAGNPRRDEIEVAAIFYRRLGLSPETAARIAMSLPQSRLHAICWESDWDEATESMMNNELLEVTICGRCSLPLVLTTDGKHCSSCGTPIEIPI